MSARTWVIRAVIFVLLLSCGLIFLKQSNAQEKAPYFKISVRPFNERDVKRTIPLNYGRFVAVSGNRLYFEDGEQTIRVIPVRSDSMLGNDVYTIRRTEE